MDKWKKYFQELRSEIEYTYNKLREDDFAEDEGDAMYKWGQEVAYESVLRLMDDINRISNIKQTK